MDDSFFKKCTGPAVIQSSIGWRMAEKHLGRNLGSTLVEILGKDCCGKAPTLTLGGYDPSVTATR